MPDEILGQLGNRFQHALRAFTPRDQKAVKTAAETFVANPDLDVATTIGKLGVGEALVSTLQDKGIPSPVEHTLVAPPRCRMGAITDAERMQVRNGSPVGGKYDTAIDRESAAEMLAKKAEAKVEQAQAPKAESPVEDKDDGGGIGGVFREFLFGSTGPRGGKRDGIVQQVARNEARRMGTKVLRGVLGGIFGGRP